MQGIGQDFRLAVRGLFATRVVSTIAVLSLALGIGANTAIFSLVNSVLLRTLPVVEPERLVTVSSEFAISRGYKAGAGWSYTMWDRLRQRSQLFDGAFAWTLVRLNLGHGGQAQPVNTLFVSGEFFSTLGVPALHGRVLRSTDDVLGGGADGPVAVISHSLWQRRFAAAPGVIGTSIVVEGTPVTIVGVTPRRFIGLEVGQEFDVAMPIGVEPLIRGKNGSVIMSERAYTLIVLLRLKPGQSLDAATATIRGVQSEIVPANAPRFVTPIVLAPAAEGTSLPGGPAGSGGLRQRFEQPLMTIMVAVAVVLLVACVNIANLLLARAAARRHELSVRVALGAPRWRLVRQLLVESFVLAAAGGLGGVLFAGWATRVLVAQLSTSTSKVTLDLSLDWRVTLFTAAITIATAILFGIAPALGAARVAPMEALKTRGPGSDARRPSRSRLGVASALVILQVAMSLVLVAAAGLFGRTFQQLAMRPLGFDAERVLVVTVTTNRATIDRGGQLPLFARLVEGVAAVPGVDRAAGSSWTPLSGGGALLGVDVPGLPKETERGVVANFVTPGWFAAYGTPIRGGRDVAPGDTESSPPIMVVNEAFGRRFFPGRSPIGEIVTVGRERKVTIVGVAGDAVFRAAGMIPGVASLALRNGVAPMIYMPLQQSRGMGPSESNTMSISARSAAGSPARLAPAIGSALTEIDGDVVFAFRPLSDFVSAALSQERMVAMLAGFFGVLALLLAGLGLYGVTSYAVSLRRAEIGVRLALGAEPGGVMRLVLARVLVLVGLGVAVGGVVTAWASKFVAALLYGLEPRDPSTLAGAAVVLAAAGALAGWLPARRASRTDPAVVLRTE